MAAMAQKQNGYLNATRTVGMPRDVEYQLFARVTGRLNQGMREGAEFRELVAALQENLTVWRTFALEVMDDNNALPAQLRAQIFYLYEFTRTHTQRVMRREATADALVEINTSMMRGLRKSTVMEQV